MPGLTRTEFNALRRTPPTEEQRASFMTPEDVAEAIVFICELPPHLMIPSVTIVPTVNPWNR
jgi:NADP-dependent 3-hydroxy acid dehydrogenase YdfG